MVAPTPTAGPLTATITGLREAAMRSETMPPPSRRTPAIVPPALRVVAAPGERRPAARQVSARAEAAPGPGEQDDPDGVVGVGQVEGRDKLARHRGGEGVEPLGPVQCHCGRAARYVVADLAETRLAVFVDRGASFVRGQVCRPL